MHVNDDDRRPRRKSATSASAQRNGSSTGGMKVRPIRFSTPTVTPLATKSSGAAARNGRRIVRRPDDAVAGFQILVEIALVEDVIAAGDEVDAACEHFFGGLRGQAKTARGVFAVGNAGMDLVLLSKQGDAALEHLAPGGTDDVPDDAAALRGLLSARRRLRFLLGFEEVDEHALFFSKAHQTLGLRGVAQRSTAYSAASSSAAGSASR